MSFFFYSLACSIFVFLLLSGCNGNAEINGTYVSSANSSDTLFIIKDGTFTRKVSDTAVDRGTWYIKDNDIWFSGWVNRGEERELMGGGEPGLSGFTLKNSWFMRNNRIYFSPYESTYFEQIR